MITAGKEEHKTWRLFWNSSGGSIPTRILAVLGSVLLFFRDAIKEKHGQFKRALPPHRPHGNV